MADPWDAFPDAPKPRTAAMAVRTAPPAQAADPWAAYPDAEPQGMPWRDVPGQALRNAPESAGNFAHSLVQPFLHPVDTGGALLSLLDAVGSKVSRPGNLVRAGDPAPTPEQLQARATREAPADAVGAFFKDRYGSEEGIKKTIAKDPVGLAGDLSMLLTGAGTLPTRLAPALSRAGAMVDPLTQAGNAVRLTGRGVGLSLSELLGFTTGAGGTSVRTAASSGREGGEVGHVFRDNMRGAPVSDVVDRARGALGQVRRERADAYREGRADLSRDTSTIDFAAIDGAVTRASEVGQFRGQSGVAPAVTVEPRAAAIVEEMQGITNAWRALDPAEYHTPTGIDALKRSLGNIRDSTQFGTPERVAADRIYNAVRGELTAAAPGYARMMEDYSRASEAINEATRTFSLGERATGDTAARKLMSATRNNVQTNYGERTRLLNMLAEHDPTLPAAVAGQATNSAMPRGLVARLGGMAAAPAAAGAAMSNPMTLLGLPAMAAFSPRAVGEVAHAGGRATGGIEMLADLLGINAPNVRSAGQGAFQAGRLSEQEKKRLLARGLLRINENQAPAPSGRGLLGIGP